MMTKVTERIDEIEILIDNGIYSNQTEVDSKKILEIFKNLKEEIRILRDEYLNDQ